MNRKEKLANIYIKIYNKRPLTMNDLEFLSKYDPECFAKTCQNLIYNIPETKELLRVEQEDSVKQLPAEAERVPVGERLPQRKEKVELLMHNLKKMEKEEIFVQNVKADKVKNLLGSLYMEMLFPHNDKERYFEMETEEAEPTFNKKV